MRFDELNFTVNEVLFFLKDQGVKYDKKNGTFSVGYQGKKLPSIYYVPKDDVISISFQSVNNDFGRLSYELDYVNFCYLYDRNEVDVFLDSLKNDYLKMVIVFFNLNPTLIKKAVSKKCKKEKIRLILKEKYVKLFLNGKE